MQGCCALANLAPMPTPKTRPPLRTAPVKPPIPFNAEVVARIIARVAAGEVLADALRSDPEAPGWDQFWYWLQDRPDLHTAYMNARERSAHALAATVKLVADEVHSGALEPARARVVIEAYQWLARVYAPRFYGERFATPGGTTLIVQTTLALSGDAPRDAGVSGGYVLTASPALATPGEGDPPIGSHRPPPGQRGVPHRLRGPEKSKSGHEGGKPVGRGPAGPEPEHK